MKKLTFLFLVSACGGAAADGSMTATTSAAPTAEALPTAAATVEAAPSDATHDDLCLAVHFRGDDARAMTECTAACDESAKDSCRILGTMYENGEGTAADPARASRLYAKACSLGNAAACAARPPAATTNAPGVHFSVGSLEADGVRLTNLSCDSVEGGLPGGIFGGIALVAGFTSRKTALDACAGRATTTRIEWTGAAGRMTHVKAHGSSPAVDRCVERALAGAPSTVTGVCSTELHHGR